MPTTLADMTTMDGDRNTNRDYVARIATTTTTTLIGNAGQDEDDKDDYDSGVKKTMTNDVAKRPPVASAATRPTTMRRNF